MISLLPLRLAASMLALAAVLPSHAAYCRTVAPAAASAPVIQMEHISIRSIGRGSPVVLIPGLSSPRATWSASVGSLMSGSRV